MVNPYSMFVIEVVSMLIQAINKIKEIAVHIQKDDPK